MHRQPPEKGLIMAGDWLPLMLEKNVGLLAMYSPDYHCPIVNCFRLTVKDRKKLKKQKNNKKLNLKLFLFSKYLSYLTAQCT